jgi:hypothetical protein
MCIWLAYHDEPAVFSSTRYSHQHRPNISPNTQIGSEENSFLISTTNANSVDLVDFIINLALNVLTGSAHKTVVSLILLT